MAIPVKIPCASPTERMPYTLATMVSEMLLNNFRACPGDSGIISSARRIQSRPSRNRKKTTTSAIRDLAIRRAKLPRIAAPEPRTNTPACCTWEVTAPRMSYFETSIQRPRNFNPRSAMVVRNSVKPPCSALLRVRYCAAVTASFAASIMMMNTGTPKRKSNARVESSEAVPGLPFVHLRIRWCTG